MDAQRVRAVGAPATPWPREASRSFPSEFWEGCRGRTSPSGIAEAGRVCVRTRERGCTNHTLMTAHLSLGSPTSPVALLGGGGKAGLTAES